MDPYTTYDKKEKLIKKIIERIEKQNGGIILLHDGRDGHERNTKELQKNLIALITVPGFQKL
jgi:hypothetical protein